MLTSGVRGKYLLIVISISGFSYFFNFASLINVWGKQNGEIQDKNKLNTML
jgi:hypothetical protein